MVDFFGPTGWRCPGCSRCFSPQTPECAYCNTSTFLGISGNVHVYTSPSACIVHDFDAPDTAGTVRCKRCHHTEPAHNVMLTPGGSP